jgi:DNA-binding XRE family transcriptional regulator
MAGRRPRRDEDALHSMEGATVKTGTDIAHLRQACGLTQLELARAAGYERETLAKFERGHTSMRFLTVVDMIECLGFELVLRRKDGP